MTWVILGIVVLVFSGMAIWGLLRGVTAWGGDRADGLEAASQVITEANAYRGSVGPEDTPMDGRRRIAQPKDDAGFGFFG